MARVEIRQLTKRYGPETVVRDLDLDIADGELLVVAGPSGCGKSTVLRAIAGFVEPTNGSITIDGVAVGDHPPQRPLAMMFQEAVLYPHLDVRANIGFPLAIAGERSSDIRREVESIAGALGIRTLLSRRPRQLSGGQRQRVAMARSLIRRPELLLMDEPMSNLDAKLRTELRAAIGHLHQERDITMVYVTHDQVEAMSLGDRIAVMRGGRIVQIGVPDEVYHRPVDAFVATFIGMPPMNLFLGRLDPLGPTLVVGSSSIPLGRSRWRRLASASARDVVVGIRPQCFRFADDGIVVDVEHVDHVADRSHVVATLLAKPVTVTGEGVAIGAGSTRLEIEVAAADRLGAGRWQASHVTVDVDDIHLFDHRTGRSLTAPTDAEPSLPHAMVATT